MPSAINAKPSSQQSVQGGFVVCHHTNEGSRLVCRLRDDPPNFGEGKIILLEGICDVLKGDLLGHSGNHNGKAVATGLLALWLPALGSNHNGGCFGGMHQSGLDGRSRDGISGDQCGSVELPIEAEVSDLKVGRDDC